MTNAVYLADIVPFLKYNKGQGLIRGAHTKFSSPLDWNLKKFATEVT